MAVTAQMRADVSQLYVALFGRAPDGEGLGYWVQQLSNGQTLKSVADTMYATTPARTYYPSFMTNSEIVNSFYVKVLGRTPDAEGAAYWTAKLNASGATPGSVMTELMSVVTNYTGTDAAGLVSKNLFLNKASVAQYYGEANGTVAGATTVLTGVTDAAATVVTAKASVDSGSTSGVNQGQTFTLTAGADLGSTFTGANGNDSFNGQVNTPNAPAATSTFNVGDTLTGGSGTDSLNIAVTGATGTGGTLTAATVTGIENINIRAVMDVAADITTVTGSNFTGATTFSADRATSAVAFDGLAAGQAVGVIGNGAMLNGAVTATYGATVTAGVFNISGGTGTAGANANAVLTEVGAGITSNTINSTGAANILNNVVLSGAANVALTINAATNLNTGLITGFTGTTSTITVTGAAAVVNIGTLETATVKTVNASGMTAGGVTATLNATTTVNFTGGQGADIITLGAVLATGGMVDAGAGVDRLVVGNTALVTAVTAPFIKGFEVVAVGNGATVDVTMLAANNTIVAGIIADAGGATGLTGLSAAQAAAITISTAGAVGAITLGLTGAATGGQIDTVKATMLNTSTTTGAAVAMDLTGIVLAGVEKLELTGNGTAAVNSGALTLTTTAATSLDSIKVTTAGTSSVVIAAGQTGTNLNIDASASSGAAVLDASLYATATGSTIKGGTSHDIIEGSALGDNITGGAGNDILSGTATVGQTAGTDTAVGTIATSVAASTNADTFTGGAGLDVFAIGIGAVATMSTITDLNLGTGVVGGAVDRIVTDGTAATVTVAVLTAGQQLTVTNAATFADALDAAVAALGAVASVATTFTYGTDTYFLLNDIAATTTFTATDLVIKITGVTGTLDASDITLL